VFIVSLIVYSNCRVLQFSHQMFNVSALLPVDALLKCVVSCYRSNYLCRLFIFTTFHIRERNCRNWLAIDVASTLAQIYRESKDFHFPYVSPKLSPRPWQIGRSSIRRKERLSHSKQRCMRLRAIKRQVLARDDDARRPGTLKCTPLSSDARRHKATRHSVTRNDVITSCVQFM